MPTLQAAAKPLLQGEEVRPATAEGLICWVTSAAAAAALGVAAVAQHTGRFCSHKTVSISMVSLMCM